MFSNVPTVGVVNGAEIAPDTTSYHHSTLADELRLSSQVGAEREAFVLSKKCFDDIRVWGYI